LWSPELAAVWTRGYAYIVSAMRRGERTGVSESTQTGSQSGDARAHAPPSSATGTRPPPTRYAYVGEVGVAWQTFGARAPDLLLHLGWISHLDHVWRHPLPVGFLRRLGAAARVIAFDKRGVGLSERVHNLPRLQEGLEDQLAVLDAAGSRRAVVFGVGEGATSALLLAAVFPERVRGVVCFNATSKLLRDDDHPAGMDPAFLQRAADLFRRHWGDARFAQEEAPSLASDGDFCAWYGEYLRSASSPGQALAQVRLSAGYDPRVFLPFVKVPTLVLSRAGNQVVSAAAGRDLASRVAGARFVELPGADNLVFAGDLGGALIELDAFLSDPRLDAPAPAPLTTLAFVRADRADAPRLAVAAERFESLGARAISLPDARTALYATPWFSGATELATQLVSSPEAAAAGLRVALHAEALDLARLQGTVAMEALRAAAERLAPGTAAASTLVEALNAGTAFKLGDGFEVLGQRFRELRRAEG
jgi:pimeloyl-ACP methyl ester carboxylesterase